MSREVDSVLHERYVWLRKEQEETANPDGSIEVKVYVVICAIIWGAVIAILVMG